jgi:hypothetical protein
MDISCLLGSRVAGAGVWWHWMRVRSGYAANSKISFADLGRRYAGAKNENEPAAKGYWERYVLYFCYYFGRRLTEREQIDLASTAHRWALAQVMFHHEADFATDLTREEFENGIRLAEDIIAKKFTSIRNYDANFRE